MTIFSWNFNSTDNDEALSLSWEPQFSQDIDVDQVLLDENVTVSNMNLQPLSNRKKSHLWVRQLNSSRPSMVSLLDDPDGEQH